MRHGRCGTNEKGESIRAAGDAHAWSDFRQHCAQFRQALRFKCVVLCCENLKKERTIWLVVKPSMQNQKRVINADAENKHWRHVHEGVERHAQPLTQTNSRC